MFKLVLFIMFFTTMPKVYAEACKVYGISDSPQKLSCSFRGLKMNLTCVEGQYYLNDIKVDEAFHFEVESGPTPLAFKTVEELLVVTIESPRRISAELEGRGRFLKGTCRL